MSFYTFALEELNLKNPRSKNGDILLISFGVVVNKRDQGYYVLTAPTFPHRYSPSELNSSAEVNGYALPKHANSRSPWTIGPVEVADNDEVAIVYSGTNISDDPSFAASDAFAQGETKLVSDFYAFLLGDVWSALGLGGVEGVINAIDLPEDLKEFLSNPVGYALGLRPSGPCNGVVFKDAIKTTGRELAALAYEPKPVDLDLRKYLGAPGIARSTRSYTDAETHNREICGMEANTDVTIAIVQYSVYSFVFWGPKNGKSFSPHPEGLKAYGPSGAHEISVREIFGLKN